MPKLVLVDNSLAPAGGHHYEFAEAVLHVAEQAGYQPLIGAHVDLPDSAEVARRWPTERVFPSSIYHDYNLFYLSRWEQREAKKKAISLPGPLNRLATWYNDLRGRLRRKRWAAKRVQKCDGFLDGCRTLFKKISLEPGDLVMLPTVSDVELEALGTFLHEHPETAVAQWHLYFHNNFLVGRPPEYESQSFRLDLMSRSLQACLQGGSRHPFNFYTTTEQLADQFHRLKLGPRFGRLTFPVREVLRQIAPVNSAGPKRVVCAGGFRDERGQFALPEIVRATWDDLLKPGRMQILVQRDKPEWKVPLPEDASRCAPPAAPIVYHPHPLSTEEYNHLMQHADIGLLLHDAHSYYSRLSAVFQEYVCAGIPVIAPAGCWIGDQIADDNFQYIRRVLNERRQQTVGHRPQPWKLGGLLGNLSRGSFTFRGAAAPLKTELKIPSTATELIVQCRWISPPESGQYVRVSLLRGDTAERWQPVAQAVLGPRAESRDLAMMFHVQSEWQSASVIFENAFAGGPITISEPELTFLAVPEAASAGLPTGASGLSFSERSEIPRLLREMLAHYSHYRRSAQEKSPQWCQRLTPDVTLSELLKQQAAPLHKTGLKRAA